MAQYKQSGKSYVNALVRAFQRNYQISHYWSQDMAACTLDVCKWNDECGCADIVANKYYCHSLICMIKFSLILFFKTKKV